MQNLNNNLKQARLAMRVSIQEKQLFQQAAKLLGRTLSDFMTEILYKAATEIIQENSIVQLSLQDQLAFSEALLNPPEPSNRLIEAGKRHSKLVVSE